MKLKLVYIGIADFPAQWLINEAEKIDEQILAQELIPTV